MTVDAGELLAATQTVLVIDWPSRAVPEALARSGRTVVVRGGPGPEDYRAWDVVDGDVVVRPLGHAPAQADLVYAYRPIDELPSIVATAVDLGAKAVWTEPFEAAGQAVEARAAVEAAGLVYLDRPPIAEAAAAHPRP